MLWPHGVAVCISPSQNRIEEALHGPRSALEDRFIDANPDPGLSQMAEYPIARLQIRQADRPPPFGVDPHVPVVLQKQIVSIFFYRTRSALSLELTSSPTRINEINKKFVLVAAHTSSLAEAAHRPNWKPNRAGVAARHSGARYHSSRDAGITGFSRVSLCTADAARDEAFWMQV
jgi:hypothetical protein